MITSSLRCFFTFIVLFGLVSCTEIASQDLSAGAAERVDDSTLIVLTNKDPDGLIADAIARGYTLLRRANLSELSDNLLTFKIPDGMTIPEAIEEVEALQSGATAGANHAYRLQAITTRRLTVDYANELIGWPLRACGRARRVGIIDAGVSSAHPGLARKQIIQENFSLSGALPRTDHGTLMADIMLANQRLAGVQLFSANVIDPEDGDGEIAGAEAIVRALDWMLKVDVRVVNISLAGPDNKILRRGLLSATRKGLTVVAAAGNLGPDAPSLFPAAYPFAIAVTAVDSKLGVYRRAAQGRHIDIAAPGVDVLVRSENRTRIVTGTSAAATFVTSAIVASPSLGTTKTQRDRLSAQAVDLGVPGRDVVFGAGLLRASGNC